MKRWPWDGDSHIVRARKMALAYRQLAKEQYERQQRIAELFGRLDERVLNWEPDEAAVAELRKLFEAEPADPVTAMDQRFVDWGEAWHCEIEITYDDDDLVSAEVASKILSIAPNTVGRMRMNGRLPGHLMKMPGDHSARWYFYVRDLYAVQEKKRTRTSRDPDRTDKLQTQEK